MTGLHFVFCIQHNKKTWFMKIGFIFYKKKCLEILIILVTELKKVFTKFILFSYIYLFKLKLLFLFSISFFFAAIVIYLVWLSMSFIKLHWDFLDDEQEIIFLRRILSKINRKIIQDRVICGVLRLIFIYVHSRGILFLLLE